MSEAVLSYFIWRDLQRNGVLQKFTATQLENLTDGIVKTRNDWYIGGNRFRYVDQITRLDSVCKVNGIVADNPIALFIVLVDDFIFTNYFRETGKRHSFSLQAQNNDNLLGSDRDAPFQQVNFSVGPHYEFVNAIQKNMFLQLKTTATLRTAGLFFFAESN